MGEIQIQKIQRTVQVKDGDNKRKNEKESDGSRNVTRPIILGVAYRREGFLRPAGSKRPKAERARRPEGESQIFQIYSKSNKSLFQQPHNQRHIVLLHLIGCGGMGTREVEGSGVMLQEEGLEMGEGVVVAKDAPDTVAGVRGTEVKLMGLDLGKLADELLVDDEILMAVHAWGLVLMGTNAGLQKLGHHEIGIAQEGRQSKGRSHHLGIERATAVAHQHVRLLARYQLADKGDSLLGMHRQVGRHHLGNSLEGLSQCHGRHTLATGKKSV